MLYFLAFLLYCDDKKQVRWPSEESNCFASEVVDLGIIPSPVKN